MYPMQALETVDRNDCYYAFRGGSVCMNGFLSRFLVRLFGDRDLPKSRPVTLAIVTSEIFMMTFMFLSYSPNLGQFSA